MAEDVSDRALTSSGDSPLDPAVVRAWDEAAMKAAVSQLDSIRSTAEKWAGTVTALLGIFSAVALVTGTTSLDDVPSETLKWLLVVAVSMAGLLACASIVTASKAAQGADPFSQSGGWRYQSYIIENTRKARPWLKASRYTGLSAAALVFCIGLATLVTAVVPAPDTPGSSVVVVGRDGTLSCGKLDQNTGGATTVGGREVNSASQLIPVSKC